MIGMSVLLSKVDKCVFDLFFFFFFFFLHISVIPTFFFPGQFSFTCLSALPLSARDETRCCCNKPLSVKCQLYLNFMMIFL